MNKQQINSVVALILNKLGVSKQKISDYSEYTNDFSFTESDYNLFFYYLEKYFGISVQPNEESMLQTVNNTVDYVQTRLVH